MKGLPLGKLKKFVLRMCSTFSGFAVIIVRRRKRRLTVIVCDGERRRRSVYHWRRRWRFLLKERIEPMSGYDVGFEDDVLLSFRVFAENEKININPKTGNNALSISILEFLVSSLGK